MTTLHNEEPAETGSSSEGVVCCSVRNRQSLRLQKCLIVRKIIVCPSEINRYELRLYFSHSLPGFCSTSYSRFASESTCSCWHVLGVRHQSAVARKVQHTQRQSDHCNRQSRAQKHTYSPPPLLSAGTLSFSRIVPHTVALAQQWHIQRHKKHWNIQTLKHIIYLYYYDKWLGALTGAIKQSLHWIHWPQRLSEVMICLSFQSPSFQTQLSELRIHLGTAKVLVFHTSVTRLEGTAKVSIFQTSVTGLDVLLDSRKCAALASPPISVLSYGSGSNTFSPT